MRLWILVLLGFAACSTETPFYGPLPVRNQHPAQLTVLHMDPRSAVTLDSGSLDVRADAGYTSLFQAGSSGGDSIVMDGEILRTRLVGRVGLGDGWETWAELPFAYTTGGFLDDFLIDWHDFWGFSDQGRSSAPKNQWLVEARQGGVTAYEMNDPGGIELMDIPIGIAWNPEWFSDPSLDVLLRGAVELPTGDEDEGFGNGELDYSLGLVGEYRFEGWSLTAHVQHTFAGTPDQAQSAGLDFSDVTSFGVGAEVSLGPTTTGLIQTELESSTLRDLGVSEAEDEQWLLWIGGRQLLGKGFYLEVALGEDLSGAPPDFTAWLAVGWMPTLVAPGGR